MPTVSRSLENPSIRGILLVDLVGVVEPRVWTDESAGIYSATLPGLLTCLEAGAVKIDGILSTERASLAALISAGSGYFYDDSTRTIYVGVADPYAVQIQVYVVKHLSNFPRTVDGIPYDPRLPDNAIPAQKIEVSARFGEVPQLAKGSLKVINLDDYMTHDEMVGVDWDAGWCKMRLVADERR